ncbi:MAG: DUF2149 domain-containing protein [Solirubrobacterales bacterium]
MNRTGLNRHSGEELTDDPLDGLVNLFDIGIVLAVAFLIAGIGIAQKLQKTDTQAGAQRTLPNLSSAPRASGAGGESVGQVYRLPDGRLVLVEK